MNLKELIHAAWENPDAQDIEKDVVDLRSRVYESLEPGEYKIIKTGFFVDLPKGTEMQVRPRSGLAAKYGITVLNSSGTVDSKYRGEVEVIIINHSSELFNIRPGDRIAQAVINELPNVQFVKVKNLSDSERGEKGFGSSGIE